MTDWPGASVTGARKANRALLGLPALDDGASVPLRWSSVTSVGAARPPAPKNALTDVSKPPAGPWSAAAKIERGLLSSERPPLCVTWSVFVWSFQVGCPTPRVPGWAISWLYGFTSQYSNQETFFAAPVVFFSVTSSSSTGSSPNGEYTSWVRSMPLALSRLR